MQQGKVMRRIISLVLLLGIVAYIGFSAYDVIVNPLKTTYATYVTAEQKITAVGMIVRDETTIENAAGLIEYNLKDGERASANQAVATVYENEEILSKHALMDGIAEDIEILNGLKKDGMSAETALSIDGEIKEIISDIAYFADMHDLKTVESNKMKLKTLLIKREYLFSSNIDVDGIIKDYQDRYNSLKKETDGNYKTIDAPHSGIFTSVVDGYEDVLTVASIENITADTLKGVMDTKVTPSNSSGKLVKGLYWYFATVISNQESENIRVGDKVTLRFLSGYTKDISVEVESIKKGDSGECAVVLKAKTALSDTVNLRRQMAEIVYESYSGIKVPKDAWRILPDGRQGVYCVTGLQAEFKQCAILCEYGDSYVVKYDPTSARKIRAGDEVITAYRDLYDGKVVK